MTVENTLKQRGEVYGNFWDQAYIGQTLKDMIHSAALSRGKTLDCDQAEALEMICVKIARIINGNANYADNWLDIAGYATLVAARLEGENVGKR